MWVYMRDEASRQQIEWVATGITATPNNSPQNITYTAQKTWKYKINCGASIWWWAYWYLDITAGSKNIYNSSWVQRVTIDEEFNMNAWDVLTITASTSSSYNFSVYNIALYILD